MLEAPTIHVSQACAVLGRRKRPSPPFVTTNGPRLCEDVYVLGLSASQARTLRDRLARSSVLLDVGTDDELVHAPAAGNRTLPLAHLLAVVREWMLDQRLRRLLLIYGDTPYEAELRPDAAPPPEDAPSHAPSMAGLGNWAARMDYA